MKINFENEQILLIIAFLSIIRAEKQTLVDILCTGRCNPDMSLTLNMFYSFKKDGEYKAAEVTEIVSMVQGTYVFFKIQSIPTNYNLDLMRVVVTTENYFFTLGDMFISNYIQDKKATQGELTFKMMINGEAGLLPEKLFGLQFLIESTASSKILLADEILPNAGISGQ